MFIPVRNILFPELLGPTIRVSGRKSIEYSLSSKQPRFFTESFFNMV
jgi:hypothetical protein